MDMKRFNELGDVICVKQKRFLELFAVSGDGRQALKQAGYRNVGSGFSSNGLAWNLLNEPRNKEYLELLREYIKGTTVVTASKLLEEQMAIAFADVSNIVNEDGTFKKGALKKYGKIIKSVTTNKKQQSIKVEIYDRQEAMEKIARHIGWYKEDNEQKAPEGVQFYLPDNGRPDSSLEPKD